MKKKLWIFPGNVSQVIKNISHAENINKIIWYQTVLVSYIMTPLGIGQAIINYYTRSSLGQSLPLILTTSLIMLLSSLFIQLVALLNIKRKFQIHIISILSGMIVLLNVIPNHSMFGSLSWLILFIMMLITVTRMDKVMFFYVSICAIIINSFTYSGEITVLHEIGLVNYLTQCLLLLVTLVVGLIENRIYANLVKNDLGRIQALKRKNKALQQANDRIKEEENKLSYLSNYDPLTRLPNRRMFMERLESLCRKCTGEFAVVFIDLDNFKRINDTMGHYVGDLYLSEVGRRLNSKIREGDILGRLGGDEFALIACHYYGRQDLFDYVSAIKDCFNHRFTFGKYETRSTSSFGISLYPNDAQDAIELLKTADMALYEIKGIGKNNVVFFNHYMKEKLLFNTQTEQDLTEALNKKELYLNYQPLFRLDNNHISGFEALLRWKKENGEVVEPLKFIPIAEKMGLIEAIGIWVLRCACRKINELKKRYQTDFTIAVNVSTVQMKNPLFIEHVAKVIHSEKIDASLIEMEITESVFIDDIDRVISTIRSLKDLGIRMVLDDFGSGYSSLNYLKQLPIDALKIDKSFTDGLNGIGKDQKIIASLIELMHNMNISVVTEGVEKENQLAYLKKHACDKVQGFLLSMPLSETEMEDFIQKHRR
ncbi:MAG: bifunctional diguanylate cyclase/phosphodiesterase [Sporolactobacillus sp.]